MRHIWIAATIILAALLLRAAHAAEPMVYSPNQTIPPAPTVPSGLNTTMRHQYGCESATEALALLDNPGWHNWIADDCGQPGYTPTAYSLQPSYLAGYVASANDGEFWLVGSEPNIGATHIEPSDAAVFANGWVTQTQTTWACCGTLQHTGYAYLLDWLDDYLAAGGAIPDVWHIHIYFVSPGQWDATLAQFEQWMQTNEVVRPVIISETAQTNGNAEPLLRHVAQAICDGDVQAVYWYIGDKDAYGFAPSSQLTIDGEITELGEQFVDLRVCGLGEPTADDVVEQPGTRLWLPTAWR